MISNGLARPAHLADTISAHNSNNVTDLLPDCKIDVPTGRRSTGFPRWTRSGHNCRTKSTLSRRLSF